MPLFHKNWQFLPGTTHPEISKIIAAYDSNTLSFDSELPKKVYIVDEHRKPIAVYENIADAKKLYELRNMIGVQGIKKLAFQSVYEVNHAWIMQIAHIKIKNDQGINELAEMLGTTKAEFRSTVIEPYERGVSQISTHQS